MRQDVKTLLERLGDETFSYYDFDTSPRDIDIWPIFEALLRDERIIGADTRILARVAREPSEHDLPHLIADTAPVRHTVSTARGPQAAAAGLFGNYDRLSAQNPGDSVRNMLARLADSAE